MQKFKSVCPYKFHRIFKYDEKNIPNLLDNLVFEVFDMTKESFANFLTEKLEIPVDLGFAPTTEDEVYKSAWEKIVGNDAQRFYLYPKNDGLNRMYDANIQSSSTSKFPEKLQKYTKKDYSDIKFIMERIKEVGEERDIECEEYKPEGFSGDTYMYDIKLSGEVLFEIRPCCPCCHTLLPDMWFSDITKSYIPIALIARKSGGKTTYMTSLVSNDFTDLLESMGVNWLVQTAIKGEKQRFKIQTTRFDNLERMKKDRLYPNPTYFIMPPVSISISKLDDNGNAIGRIIVSIFDCPGELFQKILNDVATQNDLDFLKKMNSYMFLVEPECMEGIEYKKSELSDISEDTQNFKLLSVREQGEFQKQNADKKISARDAAAIVKLDENQNSGDEVDIYKVLNSLKNMLAFDRKALQHVAYIIVKSDELSKYPEVLKKVDGMSDLLTLKKNTDVFNINNLEGVSITVKEFFEKVVFSEEHEKTYMQLLESIGGKEVSKSWHCVSVARPVGEIGKDKICKFEPVRIAEPFARCVMNEMEKLKLL